MRTYVTAIYRQDNRKRYLRYCGIAYLYQVLLWGACDVQQQLK